MQVYENVVLSNTGTPLSSVTCTVYNAGTTNLSSIYSNNSSTPLANPFTNNADGSLKFYARNGRYDLVLAKSGFSFVAADTADILVYDPLDSNGGAPGTVTNGGTGASTFVVNGVLTGNGANAIQSSSSLTFTGTQLLAGTASSSVDLVLGNNAAALRQLNKAGLSYLNLISLDGGVNDNLLIGNGLPGSSYIRIAPNSGIWTGGNGSFVMGSGDIQLGASLGPSGRLAFGSVVGGQAESFMSMISGSQQTGNQDLYLGARSSGGSVKIYTGAVAAQGDNFGVASNALRMHITSNGAVGIGVNPGTTAAGTISWTTVSDNGPSIFGVGTTLLFRGGSAGYQWNNQGNTQNRMALTDAGILLLGTTVATSASTGELVLPYGLYLRHVSLAGTNTFKSIGRATIGGNEVVQVAGSGDVLVVGNPASTAGGTPGDIVIPKTSTFRIANQGDTSTLAVLSIDASDNLIISGAGTKPVRLGAAASMTGAAAGELVLAYAKAVRGTNNAGNGTLDLVQSNLIGGLNAVSINLSASSIITVGNPASIGNAGGGDLVIQNDLYRNGSNQFALTNPTYGASISIGAASGRTHRITATNNTAFTINNPTGSVTGDIITIMLRNTSGGALGAITLGAGYKVGAAFPSPANTKSQSVTFLNDGTNWVEISRTAADVAN